MNANSKSVKENTNYSKITTKIIQTTFVASIFLLIATQIDLYLEFQDSDNFIAQQHGIIFDYNIFTKIIADDKRVLTAVSEITNDIIFQAISIVSVRYYLAYFIKQNGWKNFSSTSSVNIFKKP